MLTFLLLASPAAAAPVSTDRAWMLLDRGCPTDALVDIAAGLEAAPDHPGLHRVRVSATWDRSWDDGRALSWIYEAWHQAEPDNLGYRVGLAAALQRDDRKGSCERVSTLLDGQSTSDPAARYEVLRVLLGAADACPDIDAEPLRAELRAIGQGGHGAADTLALYWDLRGDARAVPVQAIDRLAAHPYRADAIARTLWSDDAKGVKAHRKAFVALVEPWLASDDPVRSLYAARALGHAGQDVASHLERVAERDPCTPETRPERRERSEIAERIYEADRRPTHELALADLDALAPDIPEAGEDRALWQRRRMDRLEELPDRDQDHYEASRDRARADPTDGDAVNGWAYDASLRGEDLEEALALLEQVLPSLEARAWDPAESSYDQWTSGLRSDVHNWYDTHAWLLYRLGRHEAAAASISRSLAARGSGVPLAHAGLIHHALGDEARAWASLREAFVKGVTEQELAAEAGAVLEPMWRGRGGWDPGGFQGWLATLPPKKEAPSDTPPPPEPIHPLVGQRFPVDAAQGLSGGKVDVLDGESLLVVDLWATWCGPCVAGMPHLQQVAAAYADQGVRVVGLSVDEQKAPAQRFFRGAVVAYDLAWIGQPGWETLQLSGIPSLFVVDRDGTVLENISGYSQGDTRLEDALDRYLAR